MTILFKPINIILGDLTDCAFACFVFDFYRSIQENVSQKIGRIERSHQHKISATYASDFAILFVDIGKRHGLKSKHSKWYLFRI